MSHQGRLSIAVTDICVILQIDIEDFRVVTEGYGMQLDDDSILALFSKVSCA